VFDHTGERALVRNGHYGARRSRLPDGQTALSVVGHCGGDCTAFVFPVGRPVEISAMF